MESLSDIETSILKALLTYHFLTCISVLSGHVLSMAISYGVLIIKRIKIKLTVH